MSRDGRARRLERRRRGAGHAECYLCGKAAAHQRGAACLDCQEWLEDYNCHQLYNRDRLTLRQIHALRLRAEQHLPLFQGGKLCV